METLARQGVEVEVVSGPGLDVGPGFDTARWLDGREWEPEPGGGMTLVRSDGLRAEIPPHARLVIGGVAVAVHRWPPGPRREIEAEEAGEFLRLVEMTLDRRRPDVLATPGGGRLAREILARGRARGVATAQILHDLDHREAAPAEVVDATLAPSRFAADYYHEAFGTPCTVLPPLIDPDRVRAERSGAGYVTFVDPTPAHGVYAFARIADELGRRRPEIPLLVVEGRGTEADLATSGLDLRARGNLNMMSPTPNPRDYWGVTRLALVPTLGWDGPPGAEAGALANGIPAVVADRGGLPEAIGEAGVALPLPDRLTAATRIVPTAEEVAPWVEAVLRLWDDAESAREHRSRAQSEARRRWPDDLPARYLRFFEGLRPVSGSNPPRPTRRKKAVALVPHLHGVDWECEQGLRRLEEEGVKVVRRVGSSAIDAARNDLASNALHDGFEAMIFIDADIGFDAEDALRLLARPEPVLCGIYAKKGLRGLASHFGEGIDEVLFGPDAAGPYPVRYAATGFLRIKSWALRRMIDRLDLPLCNTRWGRGVWPFFMPMIVPHDGGKLHYLGEDWAFSHRLSEVGITPVADTSIRLWHWGRHAYGWEDAGEGRRRYRSYNFPLPDR